MLKKISVAAIAALALAAATSAHADDFLETTGNRNAPTAYQDIVLQQRAPARHQAIRNYYNQAPADTHYASPPTTDRNPGLGG